MTTLRNYIKTHPRRTPPVQLHCYACYADNADHPVEVFAANRHDAAGKAAASLGCPSSHVIVRYRMSMGGAK